MITKLTKSIVALSLLTIVGCNNAMDMNNRSNISALHTTLSSNQYPHTKAILIQEARYKFVPIDPKDATNWRSLTEQQRTYMQPRPYTQAPNVYQRPNQVTPTQPNRQTQQQTQQQTRQTTPTTNISQYAQQVIDLTNKERARAGLPALRADAQLSSVAQKKSEDMRKNNYFSHTSPTYGSPFDMMRDFGVSYRTAGENIAKGQRTPQEVVNAWMNSAGHRANILNRNFTHIGVGFDGNGNYWTQMFIGK
ncbi:CAP domain-containing protein [Anoxybacillus sp.]|uniref:CAP domain-containing protein n=1 Tax=Anoxybacillus sp. TaxID=1872573 RepID=UPI00261C2F07|nr:CAP domain-containing protein [uncultured Anoxybacillus sp.]